MSVNFSESDLEMIQSIGEKNLAWGVFEPLRPGPNVEWHLYDNNVAMNIAGLPEYSVIMGYSSQGAEDAARRAREAYAHAIEFLEEGAMWKRVKHYVKPEPEPEPIYELGNDEPVNGIHDAAEFDQKLNELNEASFTAEQETENIEASITSDGQPKGIFRRRKATAHHLG